MALMPIPGKRSPTNRIVVLAMLLGLMIMLAAGLYSNYLAPEGQAAGIPPPDKQVMEVADDEVTVTTPLPDIIAHREMNKYHMEVSERSKRPELEANWTPIQLAVHESLAWLKGHTHAELAAMAWPRGRWSFGKIMREPEQWRLQVLHAYGVLMDKKALEFVGAPKGMRKLWRVLLHDYRLKQTYTILTPLVPKAAHPPKGMQRGTYLACDGLFLKRHPYFSKSGWKWTPLLVAKRLVIAKEGSFPNAVLDERGDPGTTYTDLQPRAVVPALDKRFLDEQLFTPPKDMKGVRMIFGGDPRDDVRNIKPEKAAFDHVFSYVWHFTDEELRENVNPEVNYVSLMQGNQAPEWMRGKVAKFNGRVGYVEPWRFPEDGSGITRIYLVYAHDSRYTDSGFTWVLATLNLPSGLREDDLIETEGVFLKLYPYRTPMQKWHWAPLLICKGIRRVPEDESKSYLVLGLGVLLLGVLLAMFFVSRRDTTRMEAMRQRTMARRIARDREVLRKKEAEKMTAAAEPAPSDALSPPPTLADEAEGAPPAADAASPGADDRDDDTA